MSIISDYTRFIINKKLNKESKPFLETDVN